MRKSLTEYGYDYGPVVARAIVDDILETIEPCCPEQIPPKTVVRPAVGREWHGQRKGLDVTDLLPVRLRMVTEKEIKLLMDPALRRQRQAYRAFNGARDARWCFEAYEQGGVLTHLDLSLLSALSQQYAGYRLQEYEEETGKVVPTRGTVHDLGPSVTHKAEVIRRCLRRESPAQMTRAWGHSQAAVHRYIADFQKVRLLAQKLPVAELPTLVGLSKSLVEQHIALLRQYEPPFALHSESEATVCSSGDKPVPAPTRTTARRAGRVRGDRTESALTEAGKLFLGFGSQNERSSVDRVTQVASCFLAESVQVRPHSIYSPLGFGFQQNTHRTDHVKTHPPGRVSPFSLIHQYEVSLKLNSQSDARGLSVIEVSPERRE